MNGLPSPDPVRVPLLESRLARADAPLHCVDWRAAAWPLVAPEGNPLPGVAAAALWADLGPVAAAAVYLATPVHCEAGMVSVRLPANGVVAFGPADAARLADHFNTEFPADGPRLATGRGGRLYCLLPQPTTALTHDPQRVRGRDISDYLPAGPDAARLRRLGAEIEMWLHHHALNESRAAAGELAITGLWLWGGGVPLAGLPAFRGWSAGDDPLYGAWSTPAPFSAGSGAGVIVIDAEPGSAGWAEAESTWLEPVLAAFGAGRVRQVELSLGERRYLLRRAHKLRVWRRARPWWEALG